MDDLEPRQAPKGDDASRPVATAPDSDFSLSVDDALRRYTDAGIPRTPRSIQRYCALGHLEGRRVDTPFGQKWLVTPASVGRHIAYIKEVTPPTGRDLSRHAATGRDKEEPEISERQEPATDAEQSRHVATSGDAGRYVSRIESENEFLRGQIGVKDGQIKELTERARETNVLIAGLQKMLTPLLRGSEENARGREPAEANTEQ